MSLVIFSVIYTYIPFWTIYTIYFVVARLAVFEGSPPNIALLIAMVIIALPSRGVFGYEIISNFFYAQLVASALYMVILLILVKIRRHDIWFRLSLVLSGAAVILQVHPLPEYDWLQSDFHFR